MWSGVLKEPSCWIYYVYMLPGPEYLEDLHWPSETVIRQQYLCHDDRPSLVDVTHQSLVAVGLSSDVVRRGAFAAQSRNNVRVQVHISRCTTDLGVYETPPGFFTG